jgi:hypothetical protein
VDDRLHMGFPGLPTSWLCLGRTADRVVLSRVTVCVWF